MKTECRSLLCLMIMPGRIWVAGIDIAGNKLLQKMRVAQLAEAGQATFSVAQIPSHQGRKSYFTLRPRERKPSQSCIHRKGTTFCALGWSRRHPRGGLELQLARYRSGADGPRVFSAI